MSLTLEELLFGLALTKSRAERAAFLDGECATDPALRKRVEDLLAAHDATDIIDPSAAAAARGTIELEFAEEPPDEAIGQTLGRYKLLERVGEGGCGVVYVAEQTEPVRRRVALKVIKLGMDTKDVVARFGAERQALAMMDHPNIAKVLDAGTTDRGRPYFVMELVRGIRITDYCDQANLSTKERLALFIKVCQAIQHAHQKGIIHRDIKPSNILVTMHDGVPVPKVIDFGIAKATEGRLTDSTVYTQLHQFMGTPAYMSPEQAEMTGLDIDTRSDIYSLGVLLYELLVGRTPFDPKDLMALGIDAMRKTIRNQEPARPSTKLGIMRGEELTTTARHRSVATAKLEHLLKGDLDWIVMKCLEKDRGRRYDTANGLALDITRHLTNEPVAACPPSVAYKFQKAWRRNSLLYGAAAAVVFALVGGFTISVWQARVATKAKNLAIRAEAEKAQETRKALSELARAEAGEHSVNQLLYVSDMKLIQQAAEQKDWDRVRQLLEETASYSDRGFEWAYWQQQTHLDTRTFRGHSNEIDAVAFSPDGKWIATGETGKATLWDAASGEELRSFTGANGWVISLAFTADGSRLVAGSMANGSGVTDTSDPQATLMWDVATGKPLFTLKLKDFKELFNNTATLPSGSLVVDFVKSVAASPDGKRMVICGTRGLPGIWDTATGQKLLTFKPASKDSLWTSNSVSKETLIIVYSPDGERIYSSLNREIKVWQASTGNELLTFVPQTDPVRFMAISSDGKRLAALYPGSVWILDPENGKKLYTLENYPALKGAKSVAFSPNGERIIVNNIYTKEAVLWDVATGKEILTLKGHGRHVTSFAFSPNGQELLTGSMDKTAKLWKIGEGPSSFETKNSSEGSYFHTALSQDGKYTLTFNMIDGSPAPVAEVWEAASGRKLLTLRGHTKPVTVAAFSPDGKRIVTASVDETAKIWDAVSGQESLSLVGHKAVLSSVAFSPDSSRIVTGSVGGTAKVWNASSGEELFSLPGRGVAVSAVAFSPDGKRIVTCSVNDSSKVWDASNGRIISTLSGYQEQIQMAAFSPDGQRIVTDGMDKTAKVWDASSGKELFTLKGHQSMVRFVAFSPDGKRIFTGGPDRLVKIWETERGNELLTLRAENSEVDSMALAPDGQRLFVASWNHIAKVWTAASPQQIAAWQKEAKVTASQKK